MKNPPMHSVLLLSHSVVSNSLGPCGLQHTSLPCPSLSPGVCSNSCPLNQWCHPTVSSCHPLLLLPSNFPSIRSFPMSRLSMSGNQSIRTSASELVHTMNIQSWFPLGLTCLISLLPKGLSRVFSGTIVRKHQFFCAQPSLWSNSHVHTWLLEKLQLWLDRPLLAKWYCLFLICCLGLSWLFFQAASTF